MAEPLSIWILAEPLSIWSLVEPSLTWMLAEPLSTVTLVESPATWTVVKNWDSSKRYLYVGVVHMQEHDDPGSHSRRIVRAYTVGHQAFAGRGLPY